MGLYLSNGSFDAAVTPDYTLPAYAPQLSFSVLHDYPLGICQLRSIGSMYKHVCLQTELAACQNIHHRCRYDAMLHRPLPLPMLALMLITFFWTAGAWTYTHDSCVIGRENSNIQPVL